ncbi:hypothetical protein [Porphyromonas loveana]
MNTRLMNKNGGYGGSSLLSFLRYRNVGAIVARSVNNFSLSEDE